MFDVKFEALQALNGILIALALLKEVDVACGGLVKEVSEEANDDRCLFALDSLRKDSTIGVCLVVGIAHSGGNFKYYRLID